MMVFVLSCVEKENGGGIYRYEMTGSGELKQADYYSCDRPMYAANTKNGLCVLLREPFEKDKNGGYFYIDKDLKNPTDIQSTNGVVPCHLAVKGKDCYIANYLSGNIVDNNQKTIIMLARGGNIMCQEASHTHCIVLSPNKKFVLCCNLGLDILYCFNRNLSFISKAKIEGGYGIRHAVFSKDGKYIYAISELIPAVHIFTFDRGKVALKARLDIPCEKENADGAAIRISQDGRKLYLSLRVENAIVVLDVQGENLQILQKVDCGGDSPRDFNVVEDKLIVTNEKSNNVVVYAIKDGLIDKKLSEIKIPKPLCCVVD